MKVFIVDDEPLQRKLVRKMIDWERLGLTVAGEAEDGEEALSKILSEKPDILIMDINIPYLNGIEVSERAKAALPHIQVIILTAYGEFEYAKQALAFGAVSFVLKPVNPSELENELKKCCDNLEHFRKQEQSIKKMQAEITQKQKQQFLLEQISGLASSGADEKLWRDLDIIPRNYWVLLILGFRNREEGTEQIFEVEEMIQDYFPEYEQLELDRNYVFLLWGDEKSEYQLQLLCTYLQEVMNQKGCFWGGGSMVHQGMSELREAYQEAYAAGKRGAAQGKICIYEPVNIMQFLQTAAYEPESLVSLLRKNEYSQFLSMTASYFEKMERENVLPQIASYFAVDILVHVSLYMADLGIDFSSQTDQSLLAAMQDSGSVQEILTLLFEQLKKGRFLIEGHKMTATRRKADDARRFIDQNYSRQELGLSLVADAVGVNASYLSNIFKKECGCSLSRYLTMVRLRQACEWMRESPQRTLAEISEAVGYSDVYYFSKNFKKYYGITPSKYQEEMK